MKNNFLLIVVFVPVHIVAMSLQLVQSSLNLSNNNITGICEIDYSGDCTNISKINVSHNQITHVEIKELLRRMPKLNEFRFSHNQITKLEACMLEDLPENSYIDLSYNPIEQVGLGVDRALERLRDRRVIISLYGTRLPPSVLISLSKSLERSSLPHLLTGIGLMAGGVIALVGSTVLMITSDLDGDGQRTVAENIMFGSGVIGVFGALGLGVAKPIVSCFEHDVRQSRLYWHREV